MKSKSESIINKGVKNNAKGTMPEMWQKIYRVVVNC